uniref:Tctex1 domain containing 1 n=1 Tax=Nothobranchius pienaari TaxID=704102 RepID=A0A1A8LBA7_9TELE
MLGTTRIKETTKTKDFVSASSGMDESVCTEDAFARFVSLENTYQLEPYKRFGVRAATLILEDVLTSYLQEEKYEAQRAAELSLTMCTVIKERVKELRIPRFKIVVLVYISQPKNQGMQISSRCLWDATTDTFISHSFRNSSLLAVGSIYAVYYE